MTRFFKASEYAPGIPDKSVKAPLPSFSSPQTWEYVLQHHVGRRAGSHYDFRIGPSSGPGYSWVLKNGLPENGQKDLAIRQPDHTIQYFQFQGDIPSGYGAGTVKIADSGQVEVLKSSPDKLTFYKYNGKPVPDKFTLIHLSGDDWLMVNHSLNRENKEIFDKYPRQKFKDMTGKYVPKPGDVETPKVDGAYALTILRPDKPPVVFGRRTSKKTGGPIEYTAKIPGMLEALGPKAIGNTVVRTEVYGITPEGKQLPNRLLGGILNTKVYESRQKQQESGTPLRLALWDVIKYKGRDISGKPFEEKIPVIRDIANNYKLFDPIMDVSNLMPIEEGSVVWRGTQPLKVKKRKEFDTYVRGVFPAELTKGGIPRAGGIQVSLTPKGKVTTAVGTGFTHAEAQDMLQHPEKYIGRVAKVYAMDKLPSGKLRAPAMAGWHWEKSPRKFQKYFAEEM